MGIEDCLHIEFESLARNFLLATDLQEQVSLCRADVTYARLAKGRASDFAFEVRQEQVPYEGRDRWEGAFAGLKMFEGLLASHEVYFLLVRIKIKHMELNIIRRPVVGSSNKSR